MGWNESQKIFIESEVCSGKKKNGKSQSAQKERCFWKILNLS
jgi:hypothetical protein